MYILKNAIISIMRNKSRNILIGIVVLVIGCATAVTLSIRNSAEVLVNSYISKNEITASISMNRQNFNKNMQQDDSNLEEMQTKFQEISSLTKEEIESYGDSEYVSNYYYTYNLSMNSNIDKAESTSNSNMPNNMQEDRMKNQEEGDFTIIGYSSYSSMSEFINGSYTITSGEVSEDFTANNCVINSQLATLNNLEIGDIITIINPNNDDLTYEFVITGIFTENSTDNSMNMFDNSVNSIITNNVAVEKMINDDDEIKARITPTFILTSQNDIDNFTAELTDKGLNEYYQVTTNLDEINAEINSVSNLSNFATAFLIVTLVIGGIVLLVLNMINVRERKYEIGVLRTIGMKKNLVITKFVSELLIVSITALLLGCAIGSLMSVSIANNLLKNEVESASAEKTNISKNFGKGDMNEPPTMNIMQKNSIDYVTTIDATVDFKVLKELLIIGIALTLVSSIITMINISKFSPLTILKERT
ncbi:MAG: FtsX-like permease family protein [bacterium]|nr:FtsX-like permease family protein [bacterium]